jgi:hypothetical protein
LVIRVQITGVNPSGETSGKRGDGENISEKVVAGDLRTELVAVECSEGWGYHID